MKFLNQKYFHNDKIKNLNYFYLENFCFYKYKKINKNLFIKNINKKIKNKNDNSFKRDNYLNILNKYYNVSVYNGKKETFFINFNNFVKFFYFFLLNRKFENNDYNNLLELIQNNKSNLNLSFLIKDFIFNYSSIFDIKISKVPKKYKLKFKKKFLFELQYVYEKKRLRTTLKLLNNFIKNKKILNLKTTFFLTFLNIFSDFKNSFLWKRKINIYTRAMRKFYKKNLN